MVASSNHYPRGTWLGHLEELMALKPGDSPMEDRVCPQLLWPDNRWRNLTADTDLITATAVILGIDDCGTVEDWHAKAGDRGAVA
jgi:hypothetical protein